MQQTDQSIANRGYSLIQDCGYYSSSCGYCKKDEESSVSTGMHAHRLTVYDYQELLDQGWRRSGKFLYKPDNLSTCCRQYTIRLDVTDFQPTKAHKKLLRKWEQFLAGTHTHEQHTAQQGAAISTRRSSSPGTGQADSAEQLDRHTASPKRPRRDGSSGPQPQQLQQRSSSTENQNLLDQVRSLLHAAVSELHQACSSGCDLNTQLLPAVQVLQAPQQHQQQHKHKPGWLPGTVCSSPCPHALAAAVRKHTSQQQQQQSAAPSLQAVDAPSSNSSSSNLWAQPEQLAQSVADAFNRLAAKAQPAVGLTATASKGHINVMQQQQGSSGTQEDTAMQRVGASTQQQQQQQQQQQSSRHSAASSKQGQQQQQQQQQQPSPQQQQQQPHKLEVRMVPNQFIQEEFLLWQRYQAQQHHDPMDDLTPKHYKGFLVDTPLIHVQPTPAAAAGAAAADRAAAAGAGAGAQAAGQQQQQRQQAGMPSCGYGSFHQQYWLDGKLVAVGVVDVLPRCLSSKYFFWDPDYAWLSLGRYGALQEISWVANQHAAGATDFRYYYLGYYIHSCRKMAYKAEYPPSELLCPKRQVWVRFGDTIREAFDRSPYVVLSDLPGVQMRPNLSVPRQPPATTAAGTSAGAAAPAGNGAGGLELTAQNSNTEQQVQQREREALDGQLLFVMKQPVRWGALRDSGLLDAGDVEIMEEQLTAWRTVVGETARTLLYATAQDMLSF